MAKVQSELAGIDFSRLIVSVTLVGGALLLFNIVSILLVLFLFCPFSVSFAAVVVVAFYIAHFISHLLILLWLSLGGQVISINKST